MRLIHETPATWLGIAITPDRYRLLINQREAATLRRAIEIREEARDRLRAAMGVHGYDRSNLYALDIDWVLDGVEFYPDDIDLGEDCSMCQRGEHAL